MCSSTLWGSGSNLMKSMRRKKSLKVCNDLVVLREIYIGTDKEIPNFTSDFIGNKSIAV